MANTDTGVMAMVSASSTLLKVAVGGSEERQFFPTPDCTIEAMETAF